MLRRTISAKVTRPYTGAAMKLGDLVLAREVDGTVHKSSTEGDPECEQCMGPEEKSGLTVVRCTELIMFIKRASAEYPRA